MSYGKRIAEALEELTGTTPTGGKGYAARAAAALEAILASYASDAIVIVNHGDDVDDNGTNLASAYAAACALTPGGSALSATNRAVVAIPPGTYRLATAVGSCCLELDTEYVDLVALAPGSPEATRVTWAGGAGCFGTIGQSVGDVRMSGFTIACTGDVSGNNAFRIGILADQDISASIYRNMHFRHSNPKANQYSISAYQHLAGTWYHCVADAYAWRLGTNGDLSATMYDCEAGNFSYGGDASGADVTGTFYRCIGGSSCFGGCTNYGCVCSGDFYDCIAGNTSFAMGKEASGNFYRCRGGAACFAGYAGSGTDYGTFSGYAEDCYATGSSFGGGHAAAVCSGELVRCELRTMTAVFRLAAGGIIRDSVVEQTGANLSCIILNGNAAILYNDTLVVAEGGNGYPIDTAGGAKTVICAHCRMNNFDKGADYQDGLEVNVTNSITTSYNVVDSDVAI